MPVYLDGDKQELSSSDFVNDIADWNGLTSCVEVDSIESDSRLRLGVPNHVGTVVFVVNKDGNTALIINDGVTGSDITVATLNAAMESVTLLYNGKKWVEIASTESSIYIPRYSEIFQKPDTVGGFGLKERTKEYSATVPLSSAGIDGEALSFDIGDCLYRFTAPLNVDVSSTYGVSGHILIHDVVVNVKTPTNTALSARLELSNSDSIAANDEVSGVALNGVQQSVQEGETADDFDLAAAGVKIQRSEALASVSDVNLYLVATTTLNQRINAGSITVFIRYSVI